MKFRSTGDPVLYLSNPPGVDGDDRRRMLDDLARLNQLKLGEIGDPEIATRIAQYEMAFRMQTSVPELTDISDEPQHVSTCTARSRASPAPSPPTACWPGGWPSAACGSCSSSIAAGTSTGNLPEQIRRPVPATPIRPSAALVHDLKQRGLLDDTLVVWGGEFGRTVYCQGTLTKDNYGRDHHPRCFTIWLAGGGIKPGMIYGETDDFCYNIVENPVHVHDLHATMLHCLGIDHERLTYSFQGRDFRLTDVTATSFERSWREGASSAAASVTRAAHATKNKRQFAISWLATDVWGEDGRPFLYRFLLPSGASMGYTRGIGQTRPWRRLRP